MGIYPSCNRLSIHTCIHTRARTHTRCGASSSSSHWRRTPQPSPRRPNGHGRTLGADDGLTPDQVEGLAAFAETSAAAVLGGQSTGRVSARMAAREERLKRREELMKQGGGLADGKIKSGVKTKLASLAQRKLVVEVSWAEMEAAQKRTWK